MTRPTTVRERWLIACCLVWGWDLGTAAVRGQWTLFAVSAVLAAVLTTVLARS